MKSIRFVRLVVAAVWWMAVASCADCFFTVEGQVVDCSTAAPVAGATISVHIDQGIHGPEDLPATFSSDAAGRFKVTTGGTETCDSSATLTFQKDGYASAQLQVKGTPKTAVQQCLMPEGTP